MKPDRFSSLATLALALFFFFLGFLGGGGRGISVANAYPIGGSGPPLPLPPGVASGSFNFDFNSSFQNLVAPFENFFKSLEYSIGTTDVLGGQPSPPLILVPTSTFQGEFQNGPQAIDNWFYNLTHIRVSDIVVAVGRSVLWMRGPAQQFWQWVLQQLIAPNKL